MLHFQPKKCHIAMRTLVSQFGRIDQSSSSVFYKRLKSYEVGFPYVIEIVVKLLSPSHLQRSCKNCSNGESKDDNSRRDAVSSTFPCERFGQTVELSRTLRHTKFPIPLPLSDTAGSSCIIHRSLILEVDISGKNINQHLM